MDFLADRWKDLNDPTGAQSSNRAFSQTFTVEGTTADLIYDLHGTGGNELTDLLNGQAVGATVLNGRHYIAVNFRATSGHTLNRATINGDEIELRDAQGNLVTLNGMPQRIAGTDTYKYTFTGTLAPGTYTVTIKANTFADDSGLMNLADTETFRVEAPTVTLADPPPGGVMDREALNNRHYIDITFTPTTGASLDLTSIDGDEFTLTGANGENVTLRGPPTRQGDTNVFRYEFDGSFDAGLLTIHFVAGSWRDSQGNLGLAGTQTVRIITQASEFYIDLSGGIELRAADLLDEPLMSVKAHVLLEIDPTRNVIKLSFDGQLSIYKIGTVGATAGKFVLDLGNGLSAVPQFWGVATLETNFGALEPYGIFLFAKGTLQVNTTDSQKTETLTLSGLGPNGTDLTRTFVLPPLSFSLELVGQLRLRVPGSSTDLLRLQGGFYLSINPTRFQIYATAELSFGIGDAQVVYAQASGLLVVVTGLGSGENPGVAGRLKVSQSAGIGLPDVGDLFSASGTVSVMFNTTFQDQSFRIPDAFLPLLHPGEPTTIEIYASQPKLDGTRDPNGTPEVYIVASIQAELNIGNVLTLTGFIQIAAAGNGTGGRLEITGAVSTSIRFLGTLTGTLNLNVYVGAETGIVGRVFLSLSANQIPGVSLNGQFLLEINTFSDDRTVQTFAINRDAAGHFNGFQRDANNNLVVEDQLIKTHAGFKLLMSGQLNVANILKVEGEFSFTIQLTGPDAGIELLVNGRILLDPLGSIQITDSGFRINGSGLIARFQVDLGASFGGGVGLEFHVSALFALNTTGQTQTLGGSAGRAGREVPPRRLGQVPRLRRRLRVRGHHGRRRRHPARIRGGLLPGRPDLRRLRPGQRHHGRRPRPPPEAERPRDGQRRRLLRRCPRHDRDQHDEHRPRERGRPLVPAGAQRPGPHPRSPEVQRQPVDRRHGQLLAVRHQRRHRLLRHRHPAR